MLSVLDASSYLIPSATSVILGIVIILIFFFFLQVEKES